MCLVLYDSSDRKYKLTFSTLYSTVHEPVVYNDPLLFPCNLPIVRFCGETVSIFTVFLFHGKVKYIPVDMYLQLVSSHTEYPTDPAGTFINENPKKAEPIIIPMIPIIGKTLRERAAHLFETRIGFSSTSGENPNVVLFK